MLSYNLFACCALHYGMYAAAKWARDCKTPIEVTLSYAARYRKHGYSAHGPVVIGFQSE